jgi:uncharacterized protein (DUF433 family)
MAEPRKRTALPPRVVPHLTAEEESFLSAISAPENAHHFSLEAVSKAFANSNRLRPDMTKALVTSDPEIMGGTPVFAGTRVPVEIVLASAAAGADMSQLRAVYSFLTDAHIEAARVYIEAHPRREPPRRLSETNPTWKLRKRRGK